MIINRTEFLERPIKPGADPRPLQPPETSDPQWAIDRCLECTRKKCYGSCSQDERTQKAPKSRKTELAVLNLINSGVTKAEEICKTLGICKSTLYCAINRLNMKGELKA